MEATLRPSMTSLRVGGHGGEASATGIVTVAAGAATGAPASGSGGAREGRRMDSGSDWRRSMAFCAQSNAVDDVKGRKDAMAGPGDPAGSGTTYEYSKSPIGQKGGHEHAAGPIVHVGAVRVPIITYLDTRKENGMRGRGEIMGKITKPKRGALHQRRAAAGWGGIVATLSPETECPCQPCGRYENETGA